MKNYRVKDRFLSETGSSEYPVYSPKVLENGVIELQETGKKDLYGLIQSHKDSVDIHVLLAQYKNGDMEALNKVQGFFTDVTEMPKTYAETFQRLKDAEAQFLSLPVEVRDKFGHSFERFMSTSGTKEWYENLGVSFEPPVEPIKEEVKESEE